MKIDLTKDELYMLDYQISGNLTKLTAEKEVIHQKLGEEFDGMYDALIKKIERLEKKLYAALTTMEDQER